ncbi:MAG: hypothetical protein COV46_02630 [Deltaproteobacteria bacterium CG11_big_fil_rev_8_21_14_0_20_49_13]|nr:MAG: hypothetical protein COV46_02630 [Deltaproteobacteria bacterium CG11_big_fil_rev_8_21_14_0_20_49_13]
MKRLLLFFLATAVFAVSVHATVAKAEGTKCDPAFKQLKWHICVREDVPYDVGMNKTTRKECVYNEPVALKSCEIPDFFALVPAGKNPFHTYLYAIGPKEMKSPKGFTTQTNYHKMNCGAMSDTSLYNEAWALMKLSDAPGKSNDDRKKMVLDKLAAKGETVITRSVKAGEPAQDCAAHESALAFYNAATNTYLLNVNSRWNGGAASANKSMSGKSSSGVKGVGGLKKKFGF